MDNDFLQFIISIAFYVYAAFCLQTIAKKTGTENEWFAWVPILNVYLMCRIAGKSGWWILLLLIPLVNIVISIILWMEIAKACHKPEWMGILTIIPVANLFIMGYLAFAE